MTMEREWILLVAWLPLAWAVWAWPRTARRAVLLLKAAAFTLILLALAQPRLDYQESKVAVAVLADTSASVSPADLERASALATAIEAARGSHWTKVIPFATATRPARREERAGRWRLQATAGGAGRGTNLERAIRDAVAALPAGRIPRVALITDGHENSGSVLRAAWQARELGIPIDVFPLAGRPKPGLHLAGVTLPSRVFAGERFPIDLSVEAPRAGPVEVEITAEGRSLGVHPAPLEAGVNHLRVYASIASTGAVDLAGVIRGEGLGETRFEQAVALRRPRAVLVSLDPVEGERHLTSMLEANQFEVRRLPQAPDSLEDVQLVIFNNWDLEAIPPDRKLALENFVKQGGGLVWVAGERNVYVEKKGQEDPFDRLLPARIAPPRSPEGTCVVLIVDKSSSMEGKKMELARSAAIGVLENLRPIDMVGVLIFDNSFQWTVPIRRAQDRQLLKRLVAGIAADGGTQIAPALAEAYQKILQVNAVYKHIVLLTDGISEEGDSIQLSRDAAERSVTISTVGLGQDVNRAYLEKIASYSRGKSYFLNDPSGLEQILLRDVMEHTGSTAVEKPLAVRVEKPAEVLTGVDFAAAPPLLGYIRFIAKPTAETLLALETKDPLLVRWQYGLGRAAVFASDAKSRWAARWLEWNGFDRLWLNVFRDLLPHAEAAEAQADYDAANDVLLVDYRLARGVAEPAAPPDLFVLGPGGFQQPVEAVRVAPRHYRARVTLGGRQGLFRVRPLAESRAFPEIGFYRQETELQEHGANEFLLRQIAAATGGRYNPRPADVFDPGGRTMAATMELWPGLLGLALLLNLAELLLRKGKGVLEWWRERRPAASAEV